MSKSKDKKIEVREIVYSQDDDKSFGDIFVYEPENVEEQNLGNLFIIGELKNLSRNSSYVINLLASKIKKEFYSNTRRTAEESLEAGLSVANQTLSELANQGNGEYVGRLSMVCGTYHGNQFYLSQVGKIKSLLVRGGQIMEIIREEDSKPASPKRVFNNIASGELADGDLVLFGTSGLFNVFSLEKIRQMASSLELDEFSTRLQDEIEEEDNEAVSALVIEISGEKEIEKMDHTQVNLENVNNEQGAEELLGEAAPVMAEEELKDGEDEEDKEKEPVLAEEENDENESEADVEDADNGKKKEDAVVEMEKPEDEGDDRIEAAEDLQSAVATSAAEENNGGSAGIAGKSADKVSLSDIIKEYEKMESAQDQEAPEEISEDDRNMEKIMAKKEDADFGDLDESHKQSFASGIVAKIQDAMKGINPEGIKAFFAGLFGKFSQVSSGKREYNIKNANRKWNLASHRKLVAIVIIVALGTGAYFGILKKNKPKENKAEMYRALLSDSQSKFDQGETDIVSGSNEDAGKLFFDAKTLALRVKNEYDGLDSEADTIINKAQDELNKIDKVTKVDNIQTVATFDNANMGNLVEIAGNYYVVDGKENAVYKVDAKNSKISQLAKASSKIGEIKIAQNFQNQEILLSDGSAVSSFGLSSSAVQPLGSKLDVPTQDIVAYGRNIYVLSSSQNQIYKYQRNSQGLTGKTEWLKGGSVANAVSMAIDQNVYVLYSDGQVKKFFTGQEVSDNGSTFSLKQPSDPIGGSAQLFTLINQKYLYILEASKGRILIFDKTNGELVKQLTGDGFSSIKDISVDAKETALTALMKDKIVKINLQ